MGNRAVITNLDQKVGIYLHWSGHREAVEGFLLYCKICRYKFDNMGMAKLCQVICNYSAEYEIEIGRLKDLDCDNYDNGLYIVDRDWNIKKRLYNHYDDHSNEAIKHIIRRIDKRFCWLKRLGYFYIRRELKKLNLW